MKKIPWSQPEVKEDELRQVRDAFDADWLTMGPKVAEFEQKMADYLNVSCAVAVNNGTVALDLALKVLGVGPGDEVIVPAMTYFATASSVSYQYAIPVFTDIETQSYNLDPVAVEAAITEKTKGIVFIDYGGNPAEIDALRTLVDRNKLFLLQDAAQSLGGVYRNAPLGAQTLLSTMSFHMAKVMTSIEGGMIFTHDENIAQELRVRRNQGESGKYLHSHLGTNARMTDLVASIALAQFDKLPLLLKERARVAERYYANFEGNPMIETIRCRRPDSREAHFFFPILTNNRDQVIAHLLEKGIDTRIAYPMPVYRQEVYDKNRAVSRKTPCPVAEHFTSRVINLPIFPALSNYEVDVIAAEVQRALTGSYTTIQPEL
jgi:perosamine synthetase